MELDSEEVRVAGCLVEKQLTTPQQYPLTLNALIAACNQSSNRWPVTDYDEHTVQSALDRLKAKGLVRFVYPSHGRSVTRYKHVLDEALELEPPQLALLAALMLRGPQTPGELRARTERMAVFSDVAELEHHLEQLAVSGEPLVARLPREPGRRESRYTHRLGAGAEEAEPATGVEREWEPAAAPEPRPSDEAQSLDVKDEILALRNEVAALGRALDHILARLNR
ncbi:MAG: YceH family protein [Actinomycetota bacterium]|nr:YceH family protein [Actinomycetota bacterium]